MSPARANVAGSNPLAVTCLSCGSRLKVTDPRWIGSIVPCPKCGGLVEIEIPGFTPPESELDGSAPGPAGPPAAATERSPAVVEQTVSEAAIDPRRQTAASPRRLEVGRSASIDSEALTQSSIVPPEELWRPEEMSVPPIANQVAGASDSPRLPAPPAVDAERFGRSDSSRWISQLGSVIMLGVFGLIVATVAFAFFAKAYLGDSTKVAATTSLDTAGAAAPASIGADDQAAAGGEATAEATSVETPGSESMSQAEISSGYTVTDPTPAADDSDPTAAAAEDAAASGATSSALSASGPSATDAPSAGVAVPPPFSVPGNPLDPQPPNAVSVAASPLGSADNSGTLDNLPPGLRKFIPLLNPSTAEIGPPRVFETPPTIDSVPMERAAEDVGVDNPLGKRSVVDIPKAMKLRVAIQQADVPLAELVLLVSQLTNVPVELELISLDAAGIAPTRSCQTPVGWLPIGQWLDQSLAPLGLVAEVDNERLLVRATPQRILESSGSALELDDFGDQAAAVAAWVRPVVGFVGESPEVGVREDPAAPLAEGGLPGQDPPPAEPTPVVEVEDGWEYLAEEFRIKVPEERSALIRVLFAVEAARMARGLPPRLPRWQTSRWVGIWQSPAGGKSDSKGAPGVGLGDWPRVVGPPSGPTQDSPRTLAGMLRQLAAENQVSILVAWLDALRHEVEPGVQVMPLMDGLPVGEVLDELIAESGLQARDAGGTVWWIGSESNYDRYEVVTWVAIPEGSGEAAAGRLANSLGLSDRSLLPAAWDEKLLLVRIPRFVARQLSRVANP